MMFQETAHCLQCSNEDITTHHCHLGTVVGLHPSHARSTTASYAGVLYNVSHEMTALSIRILSSPLLGSHMFTFVSCEVTRVDDSLLG